ncbi:hypothetical protein M5689_002950 [Euphorbia peplus]|nr:hypothetical protein M5689_002950 [Euphorbia peplus]
MKSHDFADLALDLHNKGRQDADRFELVHALGSHHRIIVNENMEDWVHVSFTVYFWIGAQKHYSLMQCSIFEPNHPEGIEMCAICGKEVNFAHPSEYMAKIIRSRPREVAMCRKKTRN